MTLSDAPLTVSLSGAAGQAGYPLSFRIARGDVFGPERRIRLQMLELDDAMRRLESVAMELEDCAFPTLASVEISSDPRVAYRDADWALLLGAARREKGMERNDLLRVNGKIFQEHSRALAQEANPGIRILVVGNPCNTNCLIARTNAPEIPEDRWFAMMRLDQNRATSILAKKAGVDVADVNGVVVWGNHSSTLYPDAENARIRDQAAGDVIKDDDWLRGDYVSLVQQRGAAIIDYRGASSAASAAEAVVDSVRAVDRGTGPDGYTSLAVVSRGEYSVPPGLQFGFPVRVQSGEWSIVENLQVGDFGRQMLSVTTDELMRERQASSDLL